MIGQTFGHWSVVAAGATKYGSAHWLCRCTCGIEREVKPSRSRKMSAERREREAFAEAAE